MTRFTRHQRPAFDAGRAYIAAREFLYGGKTYAPGDPIPSGAIGARPLRQLRDQGRVKLDPSIPDARILTARRSVTIGGKSYAPGDPVPPEAIASPTRLEQLVRRGDLILADPPASTKRARAVPRRRAA